MWEIYQENKHLKSTRGKKKKKKYQRDFPRGPVVKNLPANVGDMGSIPGLGRFHMLWGN